MMSVASWVETSIVVETRFGAEGLAGLNLFVDRAGIELVPVDREQATVARRAFSRFGKGRHPARLNYGDCFSCALTTCSASGFCYKGDDFLRTDGTSSLPPSGG